MEWDSIVIIVGCLAVNYLTFGMVTSFGLLYSEIIDHFDTGKGETTWIPSIAFGLMLAAGPFASVIERKFGIPKLTILGGVTMTIGMVSSVFVPNMYLLYLTYGFISGMGFGLSIFAAQIIATLHSDKRRPIKVAIASTGSGIGRMTLPFLTRYTLNEYGWRGTFLILAGLCLQTVVVGFLFHLVATSKAGKKGLVESKKKMEEKKKNISLDFIKSKPFALFASTILLYCFAYLVPYVILPSFVQELGISKIKGDWLIIITGVSGIIGRLLIGIIANHKKVNTLYLYGVVLLVDGIISTGCAFFRIYPLLVFYALFLGIFTGSYAVLMPVAAIDVVGKENLSIALGITSLFAGMAMSVGPPIAGWIVDATGHYNKAFFFRGALYIVAAIFCAPIPLLNKRKKYASVPVKDNNAELGEINKPTQSPEEEKEL